MSGNTRNLKKGLKSQKSVYAQSVKLVKTSDIHSPATLLGTPVQLLVKRKFLISQSHGSNSMHLDM